MSSFVQVETVLVEDDLTELDVLELIKIVVEVDLSPEEDFHVSQAKALSSHGQMYLVFLIVFVTVTSVFYQPFHN